MYVVIYLPFSQWVTVSLSLKELTHFPSEILSTSFDAQETEEKSIETIT